MHSKAELLQKLNITFPSEHGNVLQAIEEMERVHLLDDRQFTENFIHYISQKAVGRFKIMMEAKKRGLDKDLVEEVLDNIEWSEISSAKRAVSEKMRLIKNIDTHKKKQKLLYFLKSRGFESSSIFSALKKFEI